MPLQRTVFTIGHSTHELEAFLGLLEAHGVTAVADVRSQPFSRIQHFNQDVLSAALNARGLRYVPLCRELGARRDEQECYVDGQAVYERVALLPRFKAGIDRVVRGSREHRIVLLCAEKEPLDCHRAVLICRHLRTFGAAIQHILADGNLEEHAQTEQRMVEMTGTAPSLFEPELTQAELIERAYEARGREIAYRAGSEGTQDDDAGQAEFDPDHAVHDWFQR
jgi:uncharacterized protein (DUF488 family)